MSDHKESYVYPIPINCKMCDGQKYFEVISPIACTDCNEYGLFMDVKRICQCNGSGYIYIWVNNKCLTCKGIGKLMMHSSNALPKAKL